ncbi:probable methyltransferase-like protein 25 isoform X2 [Daktulosphaira vitifoliae]|uniref:probable methyltransferase-like protein 25 isoform X2 n=1 Tax=Daktulosphaira vitifoliae TaxID=58002 RepID=UPI0021AA5DBE|nr:probable methyltransferase-like protein 25 isoform X2 [Daktulosphaira vitifoliae]
MDPLKYKIEEVIKFLNPFLPIANSHVVNFITKNVWETVIPEDIKYDMNIYGSNNLLLKFWTNNPSTNSLSKFVALARCYILETYPTCYFKKRDNVLKSLDIDLNEVYKLKEFMSAKKKHEVEILTSIINAFSELMDVNVIVDIGGGKGYLSSLLALAHNLNVLGIDSQSINSEGARNRTIKFEKYWTSISKNNAKSNSIIKEKLNNYEEYYEKYKRKPIVIDKTYKQVTEYVTDHTNIAALVEKKFDAIKNKRAGLVGLHTCVNVGCCYHLLEEEFTIDPIWQDVKEALNSEKCYGFPVSQFLKNKQFKLGRDARMCASQSPEKIFNLKDLEYPTKPLFYRALLQLYLEQEIGLNEIKRQHVGRLAHKCSTFNEYVHKAVKRLKLDDVQVDDEKIYNLYQTHLLEFEKLKIFFLLKQALAPVIEGLILMDRLLYLYEQGITEAFVAELFDPLRSPRNHAIIALNKEITIKSIS